MIRQQENRPAEGVEQQTDGYPDIILCLIPNILSHIKVHNAKN
jgi:hypothetical protein